jgi:hypothetical protein
MESTAYDSNVVELYAGGDLVASGKYEGSDNSTTFATTISGGCGSGDQQPWYDSPCDCKVLSVLNPDGISGTANMVCSVSFAPYLKVCTATYSWSSA